MTTSTAMSGPPVQATLNFLAANAKEERVVLFRRRLNEAFQKHAFRIRMEDEFLLMDPYERLHETPLGADVQRVMAAFHPTLSAQLTDRELAMFSVLVAYMSVQSHTHRSVLYVNPSGFDMSTPLPNRALIKYLKRKYDPELAEFFETSGVDATFYPNTPPRKRRLGPLYNPPREVHVVRGQTATLVHYCSIPDVGNVQVGEVLYSSTNFAWVHTSPNWIFEVGPRSVVVKLHIHVYPTDAWRCVVTRRDLFPENSNVFDELEYHQSLVIVSTARHLSLRVTRIRYASRLPHRRPLHDRDVIAFLDCVLA